MKIKVSLVKRMGNFNIIKLGDEVMQESREGILIAIKNSGFLFLGRTGMSMNLVPIEIKKNDHTL